MRPEERLYQFGPFRLDPAERLLLHEGQAVPLSPKAFDLLVLLTENSGHLLPAPRTRLRPGWGTHTIISETRKLVHSGHIGLRCVASS